MRANHFLEYVVIHFVDRLGNFREKSRNEDLLRSYIVRAVVHTTCRQQTHVADERAYIYIPSWERQSKDLKSGQGSVPKMCGTVSASSNDPTIRIFPHIVVCGYIMICYDEKNRSIKG